MGNVTCVLVPLMVKDSLLFLEVTLGNVLAKVTFSTDRIIFTDRGHLIGLPNWYVNGLRD